MVAIIGGEPHRFRPLIDLYREAGRRAGHSPDQLKVGIHVLGHVADSDQQAADQFFPGYARAFTEIGKERGWPPITGRQFEALLEPDGALFVGNPRTVSDKFLLANETLGGVARDGQPPNERCVASARDENVRDGITRNESSSCRSQPSGFRLR
jgi:alkanesulfonate monooxygenase SsuD/methylene tetrahydromethanopterin reductase-like flavin-dependent oxidoreductase (luciferase family)